MKKNKLLIIVAYIVTLFTSLHALNCGQFGVFTQHNGHYYTTTNDRLTFEYAKTFAELGNGYLAIPNNSAENEFLAGLILGNQFAWIGIHDPLLSNNFCYETGSCSYDSSRFKTINNGTLSFSNWGANQPDNLLKTSDTNQLIEISPLGEHWVALNSVNSKWYDFGNHNDEYNNPARYLAIYEFDTRPVCFHDDNTSELVGLHCNTAVSSSNGLTSDSGQLLECQTDENGVPFCPAGLAACENTQNNNDGYSEEHVRIYTGNPNTVYSCPDGGTLGGVYTLASITGINWGTGWRVNDRWSVPGNVASGYSERGGAITAVDANGAPTQQTLTSSGGYTSAGGTTGTLKRNGSVVSGASWSGGVWSVISCSTTTYSCPSGGTLNGITCDVAASSYPATPTIADYACDYTASADTTYSCLSGGTLNGTSCNGTYYTYHCSTDRNTYGEEYTVQNPGGENSTNPNPPTNNCVQQNYVCGANQDQTCANIGGVWQCSEHPCVDGNDIERTDTEVGSQDGDDDGWNQDTGACEGQLYLFGGASSACRSWDLYGVLDGSECCSDNALLFGLIRCSSEEKILAEKRKAGNCHYVGEFCSRRIRLGFSRICVQKKKSSCCFNSKLARIINEQGREQLGRGWGSASNPDCKGFTPEEFQRLDMSRINFAEFIESFQLPDMQNIGDSIRNRVTSNLSVSFPQH